MSDIDDELFALAGGDDDGDVEEGEASSVAASSPNSLGSDAMDESDSDREDNVPAKDSDVPYPLEDKFIDAKDRQYILSLPQLERERILGERAEEHSRALFNAELARRTKAYERSDSLSDKKRKADSIEPDDSMRKSSRQKVKGKTNDKLEAYKREREQRDQQRQRHDDRRDRRRSSSADRGRSSDIDAEGESEAEYPQYQKQPRQEEPAEVRHFEFVRISRGLASTICFTPGFDHAVTGAFARIGTGQDAQRRTLYKMAKIQAITTGKPYVFEGKGGERIATDQYVMAQYGTVKKEYPFSYLSNDRFTESEFDTYKQSLSESNVKLPTQAVLKKKFEDIQKVKEHFWSDAQITEKLNKVKKYSHLLVRRGSANAGPRIATPAELEARRVAELNDKIRAEDSERVRKALLEERKLEIRKRKEAHRDFLRKKAEEEAKEKADSEVAAQKVDALNGDAGTPRDGTPKPSEKKEPRKGLPTFRKPKMDDDIIASMDIGLDIDI